MKKNVRVGITGPISEINFGDYAMLINNIFDININDVIIFSYNKGFSDVIQEDYCKDYKIQAVEVKLYPDNEERTLRDRTEEKKVGFLPFKPPTDTPIDILYRIENIDEIRDYIDSIDVLVVNGGGYFNHLWNNSIWRSDMLKKIIAPILIASQKNKKIIFTGNSFGPFDESEEFFKYMFHYFKNATFAVRDKLYSESYLLQLGIKENKIHFIPDDLLLINEDILSFPLRNKLIEQNNIGKYIVLEAYYSLEELKMYKKELKTFSDNMYTKYGFSIVFLPFDFGNGGMNQGEFLDKELNKFYLYDLNIAGYLPIQDAYHIIKNAELVICTRYHAMVLAVGAGVPVVNTIKKVIGDHRYYYNKNYGLLEYTFDGIEFNEMDFIKINFLETLTYLEINIQEVIVKQREVYKSEQYTVNKKKLKENRLDYLKNISEG